MTLALDISLDQRETLLDLLRTHLPNTEVWAYGSRTKGNSRPDSDLDLVAFATVDQKREVSALKEAMEESSLSFRVDLFIWDEVPETFRKNILAEKIVMVAAQARPWNAI